LWFLRGRPGKDIVASCLFAPSTCQLQRDALFANRKSHRPIQPFPLPKYFFEDFIRGGRGRGVDLL
jgi:hypothetical protein